MYKTIFQFLKWWVILEPPHTHTHTHIYIYYYGRFINQFPPNIIRSIWQFERINKKICRQTCLLCSIKYVSMKKCCQNIHILNFMILQLINITAHWNTDIIHPPLMMAQSWAKSTKGITNYGKFINQFLPNIIRLICQFKRINKKICGQKMSIMFNQIYIYIYCHPQTDCFVLSELFSVARHVGCLKPGSKPIQLYVRLSLRPLSQQAYHIG